MPSITMQRIRSSNQEWTCNECGQTIPKRTMHTSIRSGRGKAQRICEACTGHRKDPLRDLVAAMAAAHRDKKGG